MVSSFLCDQVCALLNLYISLTSFSTGFLESLKTEHQIFTKSDNFISSNQIFILSAFSRYIVCFKLSSIMLNIVVIIGFFVLFLTAVGIFLMFHH